jgi:DNA-binding transcriptional MerR regulator
MTASRPARELMRIGELAKAAGVSVQTIHYYVRQGLLPVPVKTAPNMAYYGPDYLDDIRLIRELQANRFLPLSLIRQLLQAKREGHDPNDLLEMRLALDDLFPPADGQEEPTPNGMPELIVLTGLSLQVIDRLTATGVIGLGPGYESLDVKIGRSLRKLMDLGLNPEDLEVYGRYLAIAREEAALIHERVLHDPPQGRRRVSHEDLRDTLAGLRAALTLRAYREVAIEAHEGIDDGKGDDRQ